MLKEFLKSKEDIKKALLGTLFADGHIAQIKGRSYTTKTYVEITHTVKQLDLLNAVKELFEELGYICSIKEHNKNTDIKSYTMFRLTTNSSEELIKLREQMYNNRIKIFNSSLIECFNDISLLLLYLDDGSLRVRYYPGTSKLREARVTLHLNSFTLKEILYFSEYLERTYGIKTRYYRASKMEDLNRGFVLWANTGNTKKFMNIINKYYECIPSMKYKFLKYYSL